MRSIGTAIDRRLSRLIITRLCRTWPMLKLVPAPWLVPIVAPAASRLRRSLYRDAATVVLLSGGAIAVVALLA